MLLTVVAVAQLGFKNSMGTSFDPAIGTCSFSC
jgi:hypothetical protein